MCVFNNLKKVKNVFKAHENCTVNLVLQCQKK